MYFVWSQPWRFYQLRTYRLKLYMEYVIWRSVSGINLTFHLAFWEMQYTYIYIYILAFHLTFLLAFHLAYIIQFARTFHWHSIWHLFWHAFVRLFIFWEPFRAIGFVFLGHGIVNVLFWICVLYSSSQQWSCPACIRDFGFNKPFHQIGECDLIGPDIFLLANFAILKRIFRKKFAYAYIYIYLYLFNFIV